MDGEGTWTSTDDEKYNTARAELEAAIKKFSSVVDEDEYVLHWVLILHKTSVRLEQNSMSSVGMHTDDDITFVEKRGMLETAVDSCRSH
jgi:hypothetical protein